MEPQPPKRPVQSIAAVAFAAALIGIAPGALARSDDSSRARERAPFAIPSGAPEPTLKSAVDYARRLEPDLILTYREKEPGALSVSRFAGDRLYCEMRLAPFLDTALDSLAPMLNGRLTPEMQARFALSHEVGHCKFRRVFMARPDGRVADPSAFTWLAQEVAADVYGILTMERESDAPPGLRQAIVVARRVMGERLGDRAHATANFLEPALSQCPDAHSDAQALACAVDAAYLTVGYLGYATSRTRGGDPVPAIPELIAAGHEWIDPRMRYFDNPAAYERDFVGGDLARFQFREIARIGKTRYLSAEVRSDDQGVSAAHRLADFYGLRFGTLEVSEGRAVEALRVDDAKELSWLKLLGARIEVADGLEQDIDAGRAVP